MGCEPELEEPSLGLSHICEIFMNIVAYLTNGMNNGRRTFIQENLGRKKYIHSNYSIFRNVKGGFQFSLSKFLPWCNTIFRFLLVLINSLVRIYSEYKYISNS